MYDFSSNLQKRHLTFIFLNEKCRHFLLITITEHSKRCMQCDTIVTLNVHGYLVKTCDITKFDDITNFNRLYIFMNQKPSFGQFPSVNPVSTHSFHSLESYDLNLTLVVCQYSQSLEPLHSEI